MHMHSPHDTYALPLFLLQALRALALTGVQLQRPICPRAQRSRCAPHIPRFASKACPFLYAKACLGLCSTTHQGLYSAAYHGFAMCVDAVAHVYMRSS